MALERRSALARVLAFCVIATALAVGGCAETPHSPVVGSRPQWDVAALRTQLPGVLVTRGRSLAIAKLDGMTETTLWTAPAETTPTILDVDRTSGRIAILLEAERVPTMTPLAWGYPNGTVDAGIVILSADGTARRFPVRARQQPVHMTVSGFGEPARSLNGLEADRVNSAAFVGDDLLIATDGPRLHYGSPGTPLRIAPDGRVTVLPVEATRTLGTADRFVGQLKGGAIVIRGSTDGPRFVDNQIAMPARLHNGVLASDTPVYRSARDNLGGVGSADATISLAFGTDDSRTQHITIATLDGGVWNEHIAADKTSRNKAGKWLVPKVGPFAKYSRGIPGAGPGDNLLVPITQTVRISKSLYDIAPTARLVQVGPSLSATEQPTGVSVETRLAPGLTWMWLDRFSPQ